ncbi:MAG: copper amine oxidase N-terminal domain-containing protein [Bacillota bacterium]|jgi:hypothetical protein|nr:MAG: copper amine oxidase N-terminal domain-containing protein [Bacillota bacterium]
MKRLGVYGLALALILVSTVGLAASGWGHYEGFPVVRVLIDGKELVNDVPAINFHGRTLVPLRVISEYLGAEVGWDQETYTATVDSPAPCTSWELTPAQVADALVWARAGKDLSDYQDLLPMYCRRLAKESSEELWLDLLTPWGRLVADAQCWYTDGEEIPSTAQLIADYSPGLFAVVSGHSPVPGRPITVTLEQNGVVFECESSTERLVDPPASGTYTFIQGFGFAAEGLDRTQPVDVVVLFGEDEYRCTFDLGVLK